jgi:hypothetical protein
MLNFRHFWAGISLNSTVRLSVLRAFARSEIVVGLGVNLGSVGRSCVAGRRIAWREQLRLDRRRAAEGRVIEDRWIFRDRSIGRRIEVLDLGDAAPAMGVGHDNAGVDREGLASTMPSFMQRATTVSNSLRKRSPSRKRPWRFLENVE